VRVSREAIARIPQSHRGRGIRLSNLGTCLWAWAERTGDLTMLDEAVTLLEVLAASTASTASTGSQTSLPRLWWVATGVLAVLPLHAAGYPDAGEGGRPRTVIDRVISSYTPVGTVREQDAVMSSAGGRTTGRCRRRRRTAR
jgi:hypothetical protein